MITVLAGGVGAARLLTGMVRVVDPAEIVAVVNTGDDTVLHGLSISPDLDTVVYTVADAIDPDRGWGRRGETWRAMEALARFTPYRPEGSTAGGTWFNLGDSDLATHLYRTARLDEGAPLSAVTAEIATAFELGLRILPMTDDSVATRVTVLDPEPDGVVSREVSFQEYFVGRRHGVPVTEIRFAGAENARPGPGVLDALAAADTIVIAPSNPVVSIGPIRAIPGIEEALMDRRDHVVAVSPIVGGAALKGPADRMLSELGHDSSVIGVARMYREVAATLVVDTVDEALAPEVEANGMRCVVTGTIMSDPATTAKLARTVLDEGASR
jgi:LPPG:FO 2-phospho-L-lactate transferase